MAQQYSDDDYTAVQRSPDDPFWHEAARADTAVLDSGIERLKASAVAAERARIEAALIEGLAAMPEYDPWRFRVEVQALIRSACVRYPDGDLPKSVPA